MGGPSPNHVAALARRQKWLCIWCEFPMARDMSAGFDIALKEHPAGRLPIVTKASRRRFARGISATFEHIVPKANGGSDGRENGLAACWWCNNYRGTEDPKLFKERITALVQRGAHPRQIFRETGLWPSGMPLKGAIGNGGTWRAEARA